MTHQEDEAVQHQRVEERHSSGHLIGEDHTTLKQIRQHRSAKEGHDKTTQSLKTKHTGSGLVI